ncbi:purine-cytosine permease family protein [Pararobbsia silviterrae]|uniref:Allantoin permease n=1 Tax=Pararobbsia silviterrae TaxID=1792498 RepID=A0A494Y584_9BURK|nr:cytosine permease [Pararobbsia silviterrae]RKP55731.1 allantoin permease [Pararobbsia silviterrae]
MSASPLSSRTTTLVNESLRPVPADQRKLGFTDYLALWGSLGVGLLVMQAGALLIPALSGVGAAGAVAIGTIGGTLLLAWVGYLGSRSGVSSAGLIWSALGKRFAMLPIALNVLQLIGWAVFEIVVLRDGLGAIAKHAASPLNASLLTVIAGAVLVGLLTLSMVGVVRQFIRRVGLWLMLIALVWLTIRFIHDATPAMLTAPGKGGLAFAAAVDLVIAMPISWIPLVADYTRYGRSPSAAFGGTFIGYGFANAWCFLLGILIAASHPGADLMPTILQASFGALALALILIDETDNGYSDLYSAAVSSHSLVPKWSVRVWGPVLGVVATILALVLPIQNYQDFLYLLGSVFVPLFGVVIAHHGFHPRTPDQTSVSLSWVGAVAWIVGIALYQYITRYQPQWGASLPSLVVSFVLYRLFARWSPEASNPAVQGGVAR